MTKNNLPSLNKFIELTFSDPQLEILESNAQVNLFHAGVGSGKTHIIGAKNAMYAIMYPHVRGFIGANTNEQLTKSTLVGVFRFWAMIGLKRDVHYVVDRIPPSNFKMYGEKLKNYRNTISFINGKLIFLASLENYQAIDGIEFAHGDLDETKDTKEVAVKEVIIARLRQVGLWLDKRGNITTVKEDGITGFNPLNIYTSPAKNDWLAEWFEFPKYYVEIAQRIFSKTEFFRKRIGNKLVVISSSFHNEHNLPSGYIQSKLIEPNAHNPHRIDMLVYGSPLAKSGDEYYSRWDRLKHVQVVTYPADIPTHLGFDFNRRPYITAGLYKIWYKKDVERWHIHKFDEICLKPPNNTTEDLCGQIDELYSQELNKGLFIYGDYSGGNARTNSNEDDYDVIRRKLFRYLGNTSDRVIVNVRVIKRKEFMNKIFYGSVPIDFTCDPKCVNFIMDCDYLKEAPDGGKLKETVKDENGKSYEKYGHTSDETEYVITSAFSDYMTI